MRAPAAFQLLSVRNESSVHAYKCITFAAIGQRGQARIRKFGWHARCPPEALLQPRRAAGAK